MNLDLTHVEVKASIIDRISKLNRDTPAAWGKMNAAQMCAHCHAQMSVTLGIEKLKPSLFGKVFGRMIRKKILEEKPYSHNLPTAPAYQIKHQPDFEHAREGLIELVNKFNDANIMRDKHPMFGKMSVEEWSTSSWKHLDHHLKQFGV